MSDKYRWLKDVYCEYFLPKQDGNQISVGGHNFFASRPSYTSSYLFSSELMYKNAKLDGCLPQVLMPLMFLQRQCAELMLKDIFNEMERLIGFNIILSGLEGVVVEHEIIDNLSAKVCSTHEFSKIICCIKKAFDFYENASFKKNGWVVLDLPKGLIDLMDIIDLKNDELVRDGGEHRADGSYFRFSSVKNISGQSEKKKGEKLDFLNAPMNFDLDRKQAQLELAYIELYGEKQVRLEEDDSYLGLMAFESHLINDDIVSYGYYED